MSIRVNIAEAKSRLSELVERVEQGETIILCRRNVPVAEVRPVQAPRSEPRPMGLGRARYGAWSLADAFFEPLPEDVLAAFEGRS